MSGTRRDGSGIAPSEVEELISVVKSGDSRDDGSLGLGFVALSLAGMGDSSNLRDFHSSNERNSSEPLNAGASSGKHTGSGGGIAAGKGMYSGDRQMESFDVVWSASD